MKYIELTDEQYQMIKQEVDEWYEVIDANEIASYYSYLCGLLKMIPVKDMPDSVTITTPPWPDITTTTLRDQKPFETTIYCKSGDTEGDGYNTWGSVK